MGPLSLDNPLVQSAILPLAAALIATGLLALGRARGAGVPSAAIAIGFLAGYLAIFGTIAWPPRGSAQKIPLIVAAGGALGLVLDLTRPSIGRLAIAAVAAGLGGVAWIAVNALAQAGLDRETLKLAVAALFIVAILVRLATRADRGAEPAVTLLVMSVAGSIVALLGATASSAQLLAALAAATGGFLLWNWPTPRFVFGAGALLGGAVAWCAMAVQLALFTRADPAALALLGLIPFADRLLPAGSARGPALRAILLGLVCSLPAAAAVTIAYLRAGPSPY